MGTFTQIMGALIIAGLVFVLFKFGPRYLEAHKDEPKDWMGVVIPLVLIVGFIVLVMMMLS